MQTSAGRMAIATSHLNQGGGDSPTPPPTPSILPDGAVEVEYIEFTDGKQGFTIDLPYEKISNVSIVYRIEGTIDFGQLCVLGNDGFVYADDQMLYTAFGACAFSKSEELQISFCFGSQTSPNRYDIRFVCNDTYVGEQVIDYPNWLDVGNYTSYDADALIGVRIMRGNVTGVEKSGDLIPCRKGSEACLYDVFNEKFCSVGNPNNIPFILGPDV